MYGLILLAMATDQSLCLPWLHRLIFGVVLLLFIVLVAHINIVIDQSSTFPLNNDTHSCLTISDERVCRSVMAVSAYM